MSTEPEDTADPIAWDDIDPDTQHELVALAETLGSDDPREDAETPLSRRDVIAALGTAGVGAAIGGGAMYSATDPAAASHGNGGIGVAGDPLDTAYVTSISGDGDTVDFTDPISTDTAEINSELDGLLLGTDRPTRVAKARTSSPAAVTLQPEGSYPGSMELYPGGTAGRSHLLVTNNNDPDNFGFVEYEVDGTSAWIHSTAKGTGNRPTDFRIFGFPDGITLSNLTERTYLGAEVYDSTGTTLTNTSYTTVNFDSVVTDDGGDWDGSTTFTAPAAGDYRVSGTIEFGNVLSDATRFIVRLAADASYKLIDSEMDKGANFVIPYTRTLKDLASGETISIQIWHGEGTDVSLVGGRQTTAVFEYVG